MSGAGSTEPTRRRGPAAERKQSGGHGFAGAGAKLVGVEEGIRRVTLPLPFGIDNVHCYLLRASGGGWILVDTGLGSADPVTVWGPIIAELDAPIERIVVTHMHPDHLG